MPDQQNPQNPPTGTVTFLFTDIEGSTKRWEEHRREMSAALHSHDAILRSSIEGHGGFVFKTVGDAFCAAFPTPLSALEAALILQTRLANELPDIKVRAALHTGMAEERDGDYFGPPLNRVARLLSAGHGGQTLLSGPTCDLVQDYLPTGASLTDLGEHRLKDLIRPEHIFQLQSQSHAQAQAQADVDGLRSEFPPLKTLDNRPNNLPLQLTPLIGREKELGEVAALLGKADVRLVTLTGAGGTGKTRLSVQVAAEVLDDFDDGVWFVELAALTEPQLVVPAIAATLGVKEAGGGTATPILETLKEHLKDKKLLLVLDNFEQVVEAARDVSALLSSGTGVMGTRGVKVLVTSRTPLRIRGEREYAVPPLSVPDIRPGHLPNLERLSTQYEAVRLFIERATSVKADFEVTNDNAPAVAEICVRLDGLPLAIELAAARIRLFPPQALLTRLSKRLKVLTGGARDLSARQQTLRGAIDWSYDLLDEGHRQLFRRMAVFSGGRTLEALEAVCNYDGQLQVDVMEGVDTLLASSLLQQREGVGGEPRLWMLETIHEYAREMLQESGEAETLYREHALYFMKLAEQAEPHLRGKQQQEWLDRLEDEYDNLRAALGWASEQAHAGSQEAAEIGLRTAGGAMWRFWIVRSLYTEGREQLERILSVPEAVLQVFSPGSRAKAWNGAGNLAWAQGDLSSARSLTEAALVLGREAGDKQSMSLSLNILGNVAYGQGDYTGARALYEESLALRRVLGDKGGIANSLNNLGNVAHGQGDYAGARTLYEESLALAREIGNKLGIAIPLNNLGLVALQEGDYTRARTLYEESLALAREIGNKLGIATSLAGLGGVAVSMGEVRKVERGARVLGPVEGLLQSIGAVLDREDRLPYERAVADARSLLGEEAFERAQQEGRGMSVEAAVEYALEQGPESEVTL